MSVWWAPGKSVLNVSNVEAVTYKHEFWDLVLYFCTENYTRHLVAPTWPQRSRLRTWCRRIPRTSLEAEEQAHSKNRRCSWALEPIEFALLHLKEYVSTKPPRGVYNTCQKYEGV